MASRTTTRRGGKVEAEPDPRRTIDWKEALRLRLEGLTDSEIGRRLGFRSGSITRCLEARGHPRPARASQDPRAKRPVNRALRAAWEKMHRRCSDPSYRPYKNHGALGVRVCKAWESFEEFSRWARDAGFERGQWLVRVRERGPYSPGNCRWVDAEEGRRIATHGKPNRPQGWRITAFGETKSAAAWSRDPRCAVSHTNVVRRLRAGFTPDSAITTPPSRGGRGKPRPVRAFGSVKSIAGWARDERCSISAASLEGRLKAGWHPEDAIALPRYSKRPR